MHAKLHSEKGELIYFCTANCSLGYYYNSSSTSCLRCDFGCSECKELDVCDICIPGFRKINHKCYKGCPDGYYEILFKGECSKCSSGCKKCRSDLKLKRRYDEKEVTNGVYQGMCFECESGYIDIESGKCQSDCAGENKILEKDQDGNLKYCVTCKIEGCQKCNMYRYGVCDVCEPEWNLSVDAESCIKVTTSTLVIAMAIYVIFLAVILIFILLLFLVFFIKKKKVIFSLKCVEE